MKNKGKDKITTDGNNVKHESAGGFLFFDEKDGELQVAILKKVDDDWYMPKGHTKEDETFKETAIRELMEELSLEEKPNVIGEAYVDTYAFTLPKDSRQHLKTVHVFTFKTDKRVQVKPEANESFEDAGWFTVPEAMKMLAFDKKSLEKAVELYMKTK